MSEENILSGRVEVVDVALPFTPSLTEGYDSTPMHRLVIDVRESCAMGLFQRGYYLKLNDSIYYVKKKEIAVFTNTQVEKVLLFLKKAGLEFTIDVRRDKTNSGHQHVEFNGVSFNSSVYTIHSYSVNRSLWQDIEYVLFENRYSPSMVRYTGERLIWYAKLLPQHSLAFTQVGKLRLQYVTAQGHLEIYKIEREGEFVLPIYLFSERESMRFYNHEITQKVDVIPLGSERRIISLSEDTEIKSEDHETIRLPLGQYLLFHPRPQQHRVD